MPDLFRGIVKSFDSSSYTASVQLESSQSAYAANVPVSRGIPAAEMAAGRACLVVFLNPDDATDAMIVGVVG